MTSATVPSGGRFHLYLTDANGRKIAAIWGPSDQKEETAKFLIRATDAHGDLVTALTIARKHVGANARAHLAVIDAALTKASTP